MQVLGSRLARGERARRYSLAAQTAPTQGGKIILRRGLLIRSGARVPAKPENGGHFVGSGAAENEVPIAMLPRLIAMVLPLAFS